MRLSIIDLGTNSVRFDIHQLSSGGRTKSLHREKMMVKLGQGVFLNGTLDKNAIRRTIHALHSFKRTSQKFHVTKIIAIGTSALREASDSEKFIKMVFESTGIELRIISGEEEARLIAQGILANTKLPKGKTALIDIGGGSTEISLCQKSKITHFESFPLGTARLQQVFLKRIPPKPESIRQLRKYIQSILESEFKEKKWPSTDHMIGSSGTVRALNRVMRKSKHNGHIELKKLKDLIKMMSEMTTTDLLNLEGIEPKRVDMILAGAILLEECMKALKINKLSPSHFSLRDGILSEQLELYRHHDISNIHSHLKDFYHKASQFGVDLNHLDGLMKAAETLFIKTKNIHKLKAEWLTFLKVGLTFRNIGESISISNHPEHSAYIINHSLLPSLESWEVAFIASLARLHEKGKIEPKDLPFKNNPSRRKIFQRVLALMIVIDALDSDPFSVLKIHRIKSIKSKLLICFSQESASEISKTRLERKRIYFEHLFHKKIEAKIK